MNLLRARPRPSAASSPPAPPLAGPGRSLFPSFPLLPAAAGARRIRRSSSAGRTSTPSRRGPIPEMSPPSQLAEVGCGWVLCGHSERRRDHGESDALVGREGRRRPPPRAPAAPLRRRDARGAPARRDLRGARPPARAARRLARRSRFLAYEPVWAIGTGVTATPEIAAEAHAFLRGRARGRRGAFAARPCGSSTGGR